MFMGQLKMRRPAMIAASYELPPNIQIRPIRDTKEDIDAWLLLMRNHILDNDAGAEAFDATIRHMDDCTIHDCFMIEKDGVIVASFTAFRTQGRGVLHMVSCAPEFRGLGLGHLICSAALYHLCGEEAIDVTLNTDDFRIPAIKAYLKAGFLPVLYEEGQKSRWAQILLAFQLPRIRAYHNEEDTPRLVDFRLHNGRFPMYFPNEEWTYVSNPYVDENSFIGRVPQKRELPRFDTIKDRLPQPVWENHDSVIDCYYKIWEIAFSNLRNIAEGSGFVSDFIDTAFNGCLFMWDSSFILMFAKYADRIFPFQKTLDNFYARQHRDGFISREIEEISGSEKFTRFDPSSTGPNIMPWTEWVYYENFGDKDRLSAVFPPLLAYHQWLRTFRTWRDGSYWSSGLGCGMDNQPRTPKGFDPVMTNGHMVWIDSTLQAIMDADILIRMAKLLHREDDVQDLIRERDSLKQYVNDKLWDDKTAFYYDLWPGDVRSGVKTIGAYWALLAGIVPDERLPRFLEHLSNENEFNRPHRIPALSFDHPQYSPDGGYWNGGIWAPTNYMVLKGLEKYHEHKLSFEIAENHLMNVVTAFEQTGTVWENYAPETFGKPGAPAKSDFVGWSGLPGVAVLFEFVFGIKPDVENNEIQWHIHQTDAHGVYRYPFGKDNFVDLFCEKRKKSEEPRIHVRSDKPIHIKVIIED